MAYSHIAIHLTAASLASGSSLLRKWRNIGEAESILSRMRSTGFAGASFARVLDRIDPLAKLAAVR
jgi:hypothetical protein